VSEVIIVERETNLELAKQYLLNIFHSSRVKKKNKTLSYLQNRETTINRNMCLGEGCTLLFPWTETLRPIFLIDLVLMNMNDLVSIIVN
jgi:hypothetical protein